MLKLTKQRKKRENKKETYGKKLYLAPGTYRMEFYFTGSVDADTDGKITVSDKEGTILTRTFDDEMIAKDGQGAVVVTFSSREVMRDVTVQVEGSILSSVSLDHIYYRELDLCLYHRVRIRGSRKISRECHWKSGCSVQPEGDSRFCR